jgi:hypothetical protein
MLRNMENQESALSHLRNIRIPSRRNWIALSPLVGKTFVFFHIVLHLHAFASLASARFQCFLLLFQVIFNPLKPSGQYMYQPVGLCSGDVMYLLSDAE